MAVYRFLVVFFLMITVLSCNKDDDSVEVEPPRALSEVSVENEAEIQEYLKTYYYNYEEFANPPENFDYKIKISEIPEGDTEKLPLLDFVEKETILLSSEDLSLEDGEVDVPHYVYYLPAREGVGPKPTVVDSIYLRYEGSRTDGDIFDSRIGEPLWFDLQGTLTQANPGSFVKGFKVGVTKFSSGGEIIENEDGTFDVANFGSGLIIMPSALGYYNSTNVGVSYAPLIFNIQMLVAIEADHDGDGIPTKDELEIDNEGNVTLIDTDEDGIPDYLDTE